MEKWQEGDYVRKLRDKIEGKSPYIVLTVELKLGNYWDANCKIDVVQHYKKQWHVLNFSLKHEKRVVGPLQEQRRNRTERKRDKGRERERTCGKYRINQPVY